ncbi:MAG: hypothetical protein Q9207_005053 [Kuettlingeria erythrocarpa]
MDHIPYPLTSDLPDLEIPLLCPSQPSSIRYRSEVAPHGPQDTGSNNDNVDTDHGSPNKLWETRREENPPGHGHLEAGASAASSAGPLENGDWTDKFMRYPHEHGWLNNDPESQWFLCSNVEAATRAQEWLYLHLLNSFLGVRVQAHTITKLSRITGETVVDSSILPHLLQDSEFRIRQSGRGRKLDAPEEQSTERKADTVLLLLKEVLHQCSNLDEQLEPSRSIAFSIRILVEILAKFTWRLSADTSVEQWTVWKLGPTPLITEPDLILQDSFPLIEIQVEPNGGIELQVHKYEFGLRYVAISHVWSGGLGNAKANAMRSCQLRYLGRLLCRLRENGDDDLDRRHGSRKIDDGIDDLRARLGFPRKQMPLLLWIDTLCIPVGAEHIIAYKMTLNRMAQIYVTAQCTVVLDPELQNMNHRAMRVEQTYAHISCSSWMSRSWTFQEACMARIWFVQFADGYFAVDKHYIEYRKMYGRLKNLESSEPHETTPSVTALGIQYVWIMHDLASWFREMPVLAKIRYGDPRELMSNLEDWQNFTMAWNGLRDRSTTKVEDLYGIIAVVVDLSAGDVLKLRREERLPAIYRSQKTLPLALLYQTSPKILDKNGQNTWAPAGVVGDRLELHSGYVTVGTDGLMIEPNRWSNMQQPQAILLTSALPNNRFFEVEITETGNRQIVKLVIDRTSTKLESLKGSLCCVFDATLLRHDGTGTFAPGVCLIIDSQDRYLYRTSFMCPIKVFASRTSIGDASVPEDQTTNPTIKLVAGAPLDWRKHSVLVQTNPDETLDEQYQRLEAQWSPDIDHRYQVAIWAWRIVDYLRRKHSIREGARR